MSELTTKFDDFANYLFALAGKKSPKAFEMYQQLFKLITENEQALVVATQPNTEIKGGQGFNWLPIGERLPDHCQNLAVLCQHQENGRCFVSFGKYLAGEDPGFDVNLNEGDGGSRWYWFGNHEHSINGYRVVAWQPLPQPPQQEGFQDAVRNDPEMTPKQKAYWLRKGDAQ